MRCPSCADEIAGDARFCGSCGTRAGGTSPGHESRKTVTALFCDVVGSTELSEHLDPESLRMIMLEYFALMRDCVHRHEGVVEKYIGDAVVAVFGVPRVHEDDALRAVVAALEMQAALRGFNERLARDLGTTIAVRIGIDTGEVVAAAEVMDGQAFVAGECLNLAARLQQHARPGGVLIGATTRLLVAGKVLVDPVRPVAVKGRSEPVPAWHVREVLSYPPEARPGLGLPLLGREDDMRLLTALMAEVVRDRRCHLLTVLGDPGIGKSRLAAEFAGLIRARGVSVGLGRCPPYGDGGTLAPLAEALADLVDGADGPAPQNERAHRIVGRVMRDGSPGPQVEDTFWAVRQVVSAKAGRNPVVIVIDDLQWASPLLLDLVEQLATRIRGVPVFLVCLARFDLLQECERWGGERHGATLITLSPLSPDDGARLAAMAADDVAAHADGHREAVDPGRIAEKAEGNPFIIEQMVRWYQEHTSAGTLPASVHALLAARIDRLTPRERTVLDWGALLGRRFDARTLRELAEVDDDTGLPRDLGGLCRRRLVEALPAGADATVAYRFTNQQVRDVTYAAIPKRVRAARHARVAAWISAEDPGAHHEMGKHLASAFRYRHELGLVDAATVALGERAGRHLAQAGMSALRADDLPRARMLLESSVEEPLPTSGGQRLIAMRALADVLIASGEVAAADRLLDRLMPAAEAADDPRVLAHVRLQKAFLRMGDGGLGTVEQTAIDTCEVFRRTGDSLGLARCWLRLGQVNQGRSQHKRAVTLLRRALEHADRANANLERATALGGLALSLWQGPEPAPAAIGQCDMLLNAYRDSPSMAQVAVKCPLALLLAMRRRFDEARTILRAAELVLDELGLAAAAATVPIFMGKVALMSGHLDLAEREFQRARSIGTAVGDRYTAESAAVEQARAALTGGDVTRAWDLVGSAGSLIDATLLMEHALAQSVRARVHAVRGEADQAAYLSDRALELALLTDSPQCQGLILLDRAHIEAASGASAAAGDRARDAMVRFQAKGDLVGIGWAANFLEEVHR